MKRLFLLLGVGVLGLASMNAKDYYVSPFGNDANDGSFAAPFYQIHTAAAKVVAGDIIYVMKGTYKYTSTCNLSASGTAQAPICIYAYEAEKPLFDYSTKTFVPDERAFFLTGDYWHIKGLDVYWANDNAIKIEGNHNIIENCVFRDCFDSGLQIGLAKNSVSNDGTKAAYNLVLNCDSYNNCDSHKSGGNADGFANKLCTGPGNHFKGCRAWNNSDDGWDLYQNEYGTLMEECWTWHAGDMNTLRGNQYGNGNGFKMGGNSSYGCNNIAYRCVSFDNHYVGGGGKGFDQNDNSKSQAMYNCTSFDNIKNFSFASGPAEGHILKNNVAFIFTDKNISNQAQNTNVTNTWDLAITATAADFLSLSADLAKAPRQANGDLPNNDFVKLAAGSKLIDKGTAISFTFNSITYNHAYNGSAPDLGAYEYTPNTSIEMGSFAEKTADFSCSPNVTSDLTTIFFSMDETSIADITIYDLAGKKVKTVLHQSYPKGENFVVAPVSDLKNGNYIVVIQQNGKTASTKLIKK